MPLFPRTDPDLTGLIAYIVARSRERSITLTRTKLVKLLYLVDVERARARRDSLTGLGWVFFHYGPWAHELIPTLEEMETTMLVARPWHDSVLYWGAGDAPDGETWPVPTKATVDRIIDRFAPLELNELLDYVYFHTAPMKHARRGEVLDMRAARDDPPKRRYRPLPAPARPDDAETRLARWRERTAQQLEPIPPGSRAPCFDDPREDLAGRVAPGKLSIPDGMEM